MTTIGIEVKSSAGDIQIDQSNKNLVFSSKGTVTMTYPGSSIGMCTGSVTGISARAPIIAVACSGAFAFASVFQSATNTWTLLVKHSGTTPQTVSYYVFDDADFVGSTSHAGMQVFDSAGALVWSSDQKVFSPVQVVQGADYTSPDQTLVTTTLTSGPTYAVLLNQFAYRLALTYDHHVGIGSEQYKFTEWWLGCKIASNVATYGLINYYTNQNVLLSLTGRDQNIHQKGFGFLFVDVTGL